MGESTKALYTMAALTNVIIDCDPGVDDAMALLLLFGMMRQRKAVRVLGVTICHGNLGRSEGVYQLAKNACRVLQIIEHCSSTTEAKQQTRIPVLVGASAPLNGQEHDGAPFVHGDDGLGGKDAWVDYDETGEEGKEVFNRIRSDITACDWIVSTVNEIENIVLITLGPLTNIALSLRKDPSIVNRIKRVYTMGGALNTFGNISEVAEANFFNDPLAANEVFSSTLEIHLAPLNLTRQLNFNREQLIHHLIEVNPLVGLFLLHITKAYLDFYTSTHDTDVAFVHDSTAVALLVMPEVFSEWKNIWIRVEHESSLVQGMSVTDLRGIDENVRHLPCNVHVPWRVDPVAFKERYISAIKELAPLKDHIAPLYPRKRFVICMGGSFNPVHVNHIDVMVAAKEKLEEEFGKGCVVAGYLAVSTDGYVKGKLKDSAFPAEHRLEMCRLALRKHYWMVPTKVPCASAAEQLSKLGNNHGLQFAIVIGGDRAKIERARAHKDVYSVIVGRAGYTEKLKAQLGGKTRSGNILFVDKEVGDISSTSIRNSLQKLREVSGEEEKRNILAKLVEDKALDEKVADYILQHESALY